MTVAVSNAVVACPQVQAAEAAVGVLEAGGNAVDAAVCGAFVQMTIDPLMCGLGGFGAALWHDAESGRTHALDFSAHAGGLTRPDQWAHLARGPLSDGYGYSTEGNVNDIGYQAGAVPGVVDGLGVMHERWGRRAWADLLTPAIDAATSGFLVNKAVHDFWTEAGVLGRASGPERVTATPAAARTYTRDGVPLPIGATCVQPDLARTLAILAASGARAFYDGEIATTIADDFAENDGHVTLADLNDYRTRDVDLIESVYRGRRVQGMPPPWGGVLVAQMLLMLDRVDLSELGHNTVAAIRALVEAARYGIGGRLRYGSDPDVCEIPLAELLSPPAESPDTTQITVVDTEGNAVVLTHSLGYSSGVMTDGLGFLFNNYMNCFDPTPGHVDSIQPGKRRASSMAPTLVFDDEGLAIAIGAPGATRIAPSIVQVIVNLVDYDMTPVEAVSAPRVDWQSGPVELEGRIATSVAEGLEALGYDVNRRPENFDPYFARPQVVARRGARFVGAADPRRDGGTALSFTPQPR